VVFVVGIALVCVDVVFGCCLWMLSLDVVFGCCLWMLSLDVVFGILHGESRSYIIFRTLSHFISISIVLTKKYKTVKEIN